MVDQIAIVEFILTYFLLVAALSSVFVSWKGPQNFKFSGKPVGRIYTFWIGMIGSGIGWLALYSYIASFQRIAATGVSFGDLFLLLIAVLGVLGFLPTILINTLNRAVELVSRGTAKS